MADSMTKAVGTFRAYTPKQPTDRRMELIVRAARICEEYERKGFTMTLRQLYYQHVIRGFVENKQAEYDRLGDIVGDGRMCGVISWTAIEDRGRFLRGASTHESPQAAIEEAAGEYKLDLWSSQPIRPEVWVEKDALVGVLNDICLHLRVNFFACKGYSSLSEMWRAGRRFAGYVQRGQRPVVLYLGDHDPSGMNMTADIAKRLQNFAGVPVQVVRLGLNMDQIDALRLPPNPAKKTDSRYAGYAAEHGEQSWELDALEPTYVQALIKDAVDRLRDEPLFSRELSAEVRDRQYLHDLAENSAHD